MTIAITKAAEEWAKTTRKSMVSGDGLVRVLERMKDDSPYTDMFAMCDTEIYYLEIGDCFEFDDIDKKKYAIILSFYSDQVEIQLVTGQVGWMRQSCKVKEIKVDHFMSEELLIDTKRQEQKMTDKMKKSESDRIEKEIFRSV